MGTKELIINQSLKQKVFDNWSEEAKKEFAELLGKLYDNYGAYGMISHQNEILEGTSKIIEKYHLK